MVQIIQEQRKPTGLERFMNMMSSGLRGGVEGGQALSEALLGKKERSRIGELLGQDVSDIRSHDFLRDLLSSHLTRQEQAQKLEATSKAERENYEKIKNAFGEEFADVWLASPTGARTALESAAIQQGSRNLPIKGLFGGQGGEEQGGTSTIPEETIQLPGGEEFTFPEQRLPPNMNQAETVKYRNQLRKDNKPIHKENIDKNKGLKDTFQHLEILDDLSDRIPEGLARLAVDKEGNIRPTALRFKAVPKEYERFAKTVNDFLTSAKDIFGARVTNYDIAQFKSRLPTLLNSKEGRKEIIQQMKLLNQIESNYRNALNQVYRHYGLDGISEEQAENLAEQMTANQEQKLRAQLLQIGKEEGGLSGQFVDVIGPDGQTYEVDQSEVDMLPQGYRLK